MASAIQITAKNYQLSVSSDASVAEAVKKMESTGADAIIVYELGRVYGLFTEHDVFHKVVAKGLDAKTTSVRSVMTAAPVTAPDSIPVEEALNTLHSERQDHLVLVDKWENVVGLVSLRELLEIEVDQLQLDKKDLTSFIMADGPGG